MSNGSGQGTPITVVSTSTNIYDQLEELDSYPNSVVSLSHYARIIGYEEAAFWGVVYENQHLRGCGPLWSEYERMNIAIALAEAQQEMEQVLGYPLQPTWVVGHISDEPNHDDRWVDQQDYTWQMLTRYPRLLAAGKRAVTILEEEATVTHGVAISTVGPIATVSTDPTEIHVYYPGSDREIKPSKIALSGGFVNIEIPRFRMVLPDYLNTPEGGIMYEDTDYFLSSVAVKRIYNDPSVQAVLVRTSCTCGNGCSECTHDACIYLKNPYIGNIEVKPATWSASTSTWTHATLCNFQYARARLHYQCGVKYLNLQAEHALVRLAHTKLGRPPCSCDKTAGLWQKDYDIPSILTRERLNNPFGLSNGAWTAWRFALSLRSVRAGML